MLETYSQRYSHVRMERRDGILEVTLHTDGDELVWTGLSHHELAMLWNDIGLDPENKVIILTGSGDAFLRKGDYRDMTVDPQIWTLAHSEAKKLMVDLLEIDQPMIAALNGPVNTHSQIPLLCDIVLATEDTTISETHFPNGTLPGDGHHVTWQLLLGLNRARYMLLTDYEMTAEEAKSLGLIHEILPRDQLLPRARELARRILEKPPVTVRLFRPLMLQHVKKLMLDGLSQGLLMEGLGCLDYWTGDHNPMHGVDAEGVPLEPRATYEARRAAR